MLVRIRSSSVQSLQHTPTQAQPISTCKLISQPVKGSSIAHSMLPFRMLAVIFEESHCSHAAQGKIGCDGQVGLQATFSIARQMGEASLILPEPGAVSSSSPVTTSASPERRFCRVPGKPTVARERVCKVLLSASGMSARHASPSAMTWATAGCISATSG